MEKEKRYGWAEGAIRPRCNLASGSQHNKVIEQRLLSRKAPTLCGYHETLQPLPCSIFADCLKNSVTLKAEVDSEELTAAGFQLTHILCS